jgi:DNA-binding transcriptional LysR family regulator
MDELAGIRMFVRVVEGGSFVAAARGLGLSKSVITKRVKELEDRLKAQLLVRSTRRLTLTDAGASYFERCVRIVAELEEAQSAVRSLTVGLTGTLRISCIASFLAHQLARDVCRFQQQHPDLLIELHHNDRVYDPIQEGYDVCIQPADVGGEGIVRQQIVPLRRLLVATPDYFKRHGRPSHPDELVAHRCAHNNYILPLTDITFTGPDGPARIPPVRPIVLSNSIWMIREAALSGDCVAILPIYAIVDELRSGALLPVFEDFRVGAAMLNAFHRRSPRLPAKVRMLLGFLAEQYDGEPPWEQQLFRDRPHLRRVVYGPSHAAKDAKEDAKKDWGGKAP